MFQLHVVKKLATALAGLMLAASVQAQDALPHPGRLAPETVVPSTVVSGAIASVGPGDTLYLNVFGHPDMNAQVTVGADGSIVAPLVGPMPVGGQSPADIGRQIGRLLVERGYLREAQVAVEVVKVRSRIASILGEVTRPGRYPIEGRLTVLELLAMAGGLKETAGESVTLLRRGDKAANEAERIDLYVGGRTPSSRPIDDADLQAGDIVMVPEVARFFVYGEVLRGGSYPMEPGLTVMRALSIAGGLSARGSDRRLAINRTDPDTKKVEKLRAELTDVIRPGDVLHVDERLF